ncbi:MAG: hypothetical protein KJZ65_05145 [Phycisphaerales bacterium]|nr:hypothetical protein [Phycisphaerales bacterium]
MRRASLSVWLVAALCGGVFGGVSPAWADVTLPAVIGDHMVLQQQSQATIWGWASPGESVKVSATWTDQTTTTRADARGRWQVHIDTPAASVQPHTLNIAGNNTISLSDILIGEVWLCSGQSNMEWLLGGVDSDEARAAIAAGDQPHIRLFNVPNTLSLHPRLDCEGAWVASTPETAARFSAVGYFFGSALHDALAVPIGLISADWGGTRAEAWMSADALDQFPELTEQVAFVRAATAGPNERAAMEREARVHWWDRLDQGAGGVGTNWHSRVGGDWKSMELPALLGPDGLDQFDGVVYFRRQVDLPDDWAGQPVTLSLGPIDDYDDVWVNGTLVGSTHEDGQWNVPRVYRVPGEVVRGGANIVAIRMVDQSGPGGVFGQAEHMFMQQGDAKVWLAGAWEYRRGRAFAQLPPRGGLSVHANTATALYNGMIRPIQPFAIRGAIWYQGESNVGTAALYRRVFPGLIQNWRDGWECEFSFYFVQIAPFNYGNDVLPPLLREAQGYALQLPKTGMVVTTDVGNPADIHPMRKYEVGQRLAALALANDYGRVDVVHSGPTYQSMQVDGSNVRIKFAHAEGGLVVRGDAPTHLVVAGADRTFVPAQARVEGDELVVWAEGVSEPVAVRFAWSSAPEPNLFNAAGWPACPFRTDDWE